MFERLLIANRGEIAVRIARTARRMGIATVAAASEVDRDALHASECDEVAVLGPAEPQQSYLDIERVVAAAKRTSADAVHPGYGFLSESTEFAAACEAAGLVFVGPHSEAIRRMGSKIESRRLATELGIPVIPGTDASDASDAELLEAAREIGFPVMIKASAGGGGRGIRIVEDPDKFEAACEAARREAETAFGDRRLIVERVVQEPRHIEVQVAADKHGGAVHLFERECSVQRRHQKLIEEAPAPVLSDAQRESLRAWSLELAHAIAYDSLGTVEFLVDGVTSDAYLLEMNTRLQVEHPVTELVTGLDLVEWQLRVAAGEPLPLAQEAIACEGHAIETRLCSEDPTKRFLPQTGRIERIDWPRGEGIRVDAGVGAGSEISPYYDSLMAKVIASGPERAVACDRLVAALDELRVFGLQTNAAHLAAVIRQPAFRAAELTTGFLDDHAKALKTALEADDAGLSPAVLAAIAWREAQRLADTTLVVAPSKRLKKTVELRLVGEVGVDDGTGTRGRAASLDAGVLTIDLDGQPVRAHVEIKTGEQAEVFLLCGGRHHGMRILSP